MTEVVMRINGKEYLDYTTANVRWSMETFCRSFSMTFSDKWLGTGIADLPFKEGDPCEIYVDGKKTVDGFIDDLPISYTSRSHTIQVTGRSWHGNLVDCSAIYKTGKWKSTRLIKICSDVCDPFDVGVKFDASVPASDDSRTKAFDKWSIEEQETCYEFIDRACRMRGVFPVADNGRNVIITKARDKSSGATLEKGVNILRATRRGQFRERYSRYIVKSQAVGTDTFFGKESGPRRKFETTDDRISLYRPLVIVSEGQGTNAELKLRANWERNVRAGRSKRIEYAVVGAQKPGNRGVWDINELVKVNDPFLDLNGELLIISVNISYSLGGTITTLELGSPDAFFVLIPPREKEKKGGLF